MPDLGAMEPGALLDCAAADARSLLAAARTRWDAAVPHCPGWDTAELVRHQGGIFTWMATVVTGRERVSRRELAPAPAESAELPGWYLGNLDHALKVLGSADPQSATWTFSSTGDQRVAWWDRRLAVEVAIHRFDAEHAVAADSGSRAGAAGRRRRGRGYRRVHHRVPARPAGAGRRRGSQGHAALACHRRPGGVVDRPRRFRRGYAAARQGGHGNSRDPL